MNRILYSDGSLSCSEGNQPGGEEGAHTPNGALQYNGHVYVTSRASKVILLSGLPAAAHEELTAGLSQYNIRLEYCATFSEAENIVKEQKITAILLSSTSEADIRILSKCDMDVLLAENKHLRVIALIKRAQMMPACIQEMLRHGWLHDFHTVPVDMPRLAHTIGHLQGLSQLERQYADFTRMNKNGYGPLLGRSEKMQEVFHDIKRLSKVRAPVLITGESGTGKELIARTIHSQSDVQNGKFVAINCAALPPGLIASELFGHEHGAYTGASKQKRGLIEEANGGTLFLDEIGDMPLELQPYLLRFLQDGVFTRLGGIIERKISARVIVATNANLRAAIKAGSFREDLYYRLNMLAIEAPPLRKRVDDIPLLADHYLKQFSKEFNRPRLQFSRKAIQALTQYRWPGNVRELVGAVSRAVVMVKSTIIMPGDLRLGDADEGQEKEEVKSLAAARQAFDREYILAQLRHNEQNVQRTARDLDISRVALYRLMKRYGIIPSHKENDNAP